MPTPTHHPPDDLLAAYAAGITEAGEELWVASHLSLCPACRAGVERFETIGGALVAGAAADVESGALARLLARLDEPPPPPPATAPPPTRPDDLPAPLRSLCGPLDRVPFRRVAPGISRFDLAMSRPGQTVALVALQPSAWVPEHRHEGVERAMVLTGGYSGDGGHFVRGDVELRGPDDAHPHRQVIDPGEVCVVLAVEEGSKIPLSLPGRVMGWLFDRG